MNFDIDILYWGLGVAVLALISLGFAFRSMRDYEELPPNSHDYSLFLIRNIAGLTIETLHKIHSLSLANECIFSFERLVKGNQTVLAVYMPVSLTSHLSELALLELEDYLTPVGKKELPHSKRVELDHSYVFTLKLKNPKQPWVIKTPPLSDLSINENARVDLQLVCFAHKGIVPTFQSTLRCLVSDKQAIERVEVVKKVKNKIMEETNLVPVLSSKNMTKLFESFSKRTFIPKQVLHHPISLQEILDLLK